MSYARGKHYSSNEKRIFLNIIERYKYITENKQSDGASIREKNEAWARIAEEYNLSGMIFENRTAQQLKKLWSNMKHAQRALLTSDRQEKLRTGGSPACTPALVDPEVAAIVPNLIETSSVVFSSNLGSRGLDERLVEVEHLLGGEEKAPQSNTSATFEECAEIISTDPVISENIHETQETEETEETEEPRRKRRRLVEEVQELSAERIRRQIEYDEILTSIQKEKLDYERREALAKAQLAEFNLQVALENKK